MACLVTKVLALQLNATLVSQMKFLPIIIFVVFSTGCDFNREEVISEEAREENDVLIDSFRMRNAEIMQDIISELVKNNIQHWVNEDGSVSFLSSDTEMVDRIGMEAIGLYAARN